MKLHTIALAALLLLSACSGSSNKPESENTYHITNRQKSDPSPSYEEPTGTKDDDASGTQNNILISPESVKATKIIRNASVRFRVTDNQESHQHISDILKKYNAYFDSDNQSTSSDQLESTMLIRVPAQNFDTLMKVLMKESIYTDYKNITANDVTGQFVDLQARLNTRKEVEQQYLALLKKANKISDILEVDEKLRQLREEIESAEGLLKLMNDQVNYSVIDLTMYQQLDYVPQPALGFFSKLADSFVRGWRSLVGFILGLVRLWPFVIILLGLVIFYRKIRARRRSS